jgi:TRAP-type C4-dicarboxylate transport system permease small subunit
MNYAAGWGFVACALFVTFDVVARSTIGTSSKATVEVTGYMLAFGLSWALAHTLARRNHIRVDVLINRMPPGVRQYLHVFALILLAVFVLFAAWSAWQLVEESLLFQAVDTSALKIPLILPQGLWLSGIGVLALYVVILLAEAILLLVSGRADDIDRLLGSRTIDDEAEEALQAVSMAQEGDR